MLHAEVLPRLTGCMQYSTLKKDHLKTDGPYTNMMIHYNLLVQ